MFDYNEGWIKLNKEVIPNMTIEILGFVTSNENKVSEVDPILDPTIVQVDVDLDEIQSYSLDEIANHKAKGADIHNQTKVGSEHQDLDGVFVEDSGLFIYTFGGFPGPYTSYALETIGNEGILKLVEGFDKDKRLAEFRSVVSAKIGDQFYTFTGITKGYISTEIRGDNGFGFDPIFVPKDNTETFGQMDKEMKEKYNHRRKSTEIFSDALKSLGYTN